MEDERKETIDRIIEALSNAPAEKFDELIKLVADYIKRNNK